MKVRFTGLIALCSALALFVTFSTSQNGRSQASKASAGNGLTQAEQELLDEINLARTKPSVYASYLEAMKPLFKGNLYTRPGHGSLTTVEGWSAVEDAIKFVRAAKPQGPLTLSKGLHLAAMAHCQEQSGSGSTGHKGGGGQIEERVKPFGAWRGAIGENLSYGDEPARERVLTWLIDDGVANRGHRRRLLSPDYGVAGVACSPHPKFGKVCTLTLAGSFMDAAGAGNNNTTAEPSPTATKANADKSKPKSNTNTNKAKTARPPSF